MRKGGLDSAEATNFWERGVTVTCKKENVRENEKAVREKEIVKVTQVRMSMASLYLLGKCDCSCGRQFAKFQFDLQRKHHLLLITH